MNHIWDILDINHWLFVFKPTGYEILYVVGWFASAIVALIVNTGFFEFILKISNTIKTAGSKEQHNIFYLSDKNKNLCAFFTVYFNFLLLAIQEELFLIETCKDNACKVKIDSESKQKYVNVLPFSFIGSDEFYKKCGPETIKPKVIPPADYANFMKETGCVSGVYATVLLHWICSCVMMGSLFYHFI